MNALIYRMKLEHYKMITRDYIVWIQNECYTTNRSRGPLLSVTARLWKLSIRGHVKKVTRHTITSSSHPCYFFRQERTTQDEFAQILHNAFVYPIKLFMGMNAKQGINHFLYTVEC
jgi:hypothetical protein